MFKLIEEMDYHLNMSDEERIEQGKKAYNLTIGYIIKKFSGEDIYNLFFMIYSIFCCADCVIKHEEYEFFLKITDTNVTYEDFFNCMQNSHHNLNISAVFNYIRSEDEGFIQVVMVLMLCIFTCDHYIHRDEIKIIDEYF